MTLGEFKQAIDELLKEGVNPDDRIGIEYYGSSCDAVSITVIVQSDLWEAGMVVITADLISEEEGEADDG
jgi:hypothetical protein